MIIDPDLQAAIERAEATDAPVEAIVILGTNDRTPILDADDLHAIVEDLTRRAAILSGMMPERVTMFGYLGSFAVRAQARFIRRLLDQPEVMSATANRDTDV